MSRTIAQRALAGGRVFEAVIGDLLSDSADAICNAANGSLAHGGGVAAAISRAAGPELDREGDALVRAQGRLPVGGAAITTAGRLPFKGVIHVVGPRLGDGDEEEKLAHGLRTAFALASARGWTSVAFPAISSGIFMVPLPVCARGYLRGVREHVAEMPESTLRTFRLVLFEGPMEAAIRDATA